MSYLSRFINVNINCLLKSNNLLLNTIQKSSIVTTTKLSKEGDRRAMINSMPKKDEGSQGENQIEMDVSGYLKVCEFPTPDTPHRPFDSVLFKDLPIIHIQTTKNNTILTLTRSDGRFILTRSCGMEGFKNCRKGTNVAAQVTAIAMSTRILKMGYKTVRICLKGLGPGRMSSIKGLQMGGINIISITDSTPISEYPRARPPVAKSL